MLDTRSKIIDHYLSGNKLTEILKKLKHEKVVDRMCLVYRTIKRHKETGGITWQGFVLAEYLPQDPYDSGR